MPWVWVNEHEATHPRMGNDRRDSVTPTVPIGSRTSSATNAAAAIENAFRPIGIKYNVSATNDGEESSDYEMDEDGGESFWDQVEREPSTDLDAMQEVAGQEVVAEIIAIEQSAKSEELAHQEKPGRIDKPGKAIGATPATPSKPADQHKDIGNESKSKENFSGLGSAVKLLKRKLGCDVPP